MTDFTGPTREQRIKDLFSRAVELPADQRAALLERETAGDAALRHAVEELLAAHDGAGAFLADPTVDPAATTGVTRTISAASSPPPLRQIGPYKLLDVLGEGGFGTVYAAEQLAPVRRRVALKLIKPGMD